MASGIELEVKGLDQLTERLTELGVQMNAEAGNGLRAVAEVMMTEAKQRTPVWKMFRDNAAGYSVPNPPPPGHTPGQLRASGLVTGPEIEGDTISVTLAFGGPAADYAVYVHEDMEAVHETGQAKFLESVLLESAPDLPQLIADHIKGSIGG